MPKSRPDQESDEAVLPTKGALRPDRSRDGAADDPELAVVQQRAAETPSSSEPLDFDDQPSINELGDDDDGDDEPGRRSY